MKRYFVLNGVDHESRNGRYVFYDDVKDLLSEIRDYLSEAAKKTDIDDEGATTDLLNRINTPMEYEFKGHKFESEKLDKDPPVDGIRLTEMTTGKDYWEAYQDVHSFPGGKIYVVVNRLCKTVGYITYRPNGEYYAEVPWHKWGVDCDSLNEAVAVLSLKDRRINY